MTSMRLDCKNRKMGSGIELSKYLMKLKLKLLLVDFVERLKNLKARNSSKF